MTVHGRKCVSSRAYVESLQVTDGSSDCSLVSFFVCLWAALADNVKACGAEALALLCQLQEQKSMGTADCSQLTSALDTVMALGEVSVPLRVSPCFSIVNQWIEKSAACNWQRESFLALFLNDLNDPKTSME